MASAQTDKFSLFIFKLNFEGGFKSLRINKSLAEGQMGLDFETRCKLIDWEVIKFSPC